MKRKTTRYGVTVDGDLMYMAAISTPKARSAEMVEVYQKINPRSEVKMVDVSRWLADCHMKPKSEVVR